MLLQQSLFRCLFKVRHDKKVQQRIERLPVQARKDKGYSVFLCLTCSLLWSIILFVDFSTFSDLRGSVRNKSSSGLND